MKKFVFFLTIIITSLMILNIYSVLHGQASIKTQLFSFQKALADDEGGGEYGYRCTVESCTKKVGDITYSGHYRHCAIDIPSESCVSSTCWIECDAGR
jgi:hypothetical protein